MSKLLGFADLARLPVPQALMYRHCNIILLNFDAVILYLMRSHGFEIADLPAPVIP